MRSTTTEETLTLKTDVLGRVRMPADRREAILDAFEQSGMNGQAFARQIGVKYPTFATWVQKRRRRRGTYPEKKLPEPSTLGITFVEAQLEKGEKGQSKVP
jgi:transposase-like protein